MKEPQKTGIIICGDFNVWPDSNVIRLLYGLPPLNTYTDVKTDEHKEVLNYFWKANGPPMSELTSSYEGYEAAVKGELVENVKEGHSFQDVVKGHPLYTCITLEEYETLDYIFYNKSK